MDSLQKIGVSTKYVLMFSIHDFCTYFLKISIAKRFCLFVCLFSLLPACAHKTKYPDSWWEGLPPGVQKSWEIGPDSVRPPKVILSKRNELGLLSNFADTPFTFEGKRFASLEAFWQAMKFPENPKDERFALAQWPYSRQRVEAMSGYQAKKAGRLASQVMKKYNIPWVTFKGRKMKYRESGKSSFYKLIRKAMWEKLEQNTEVKKVLLSTGDLVLLPDHHQESNVPLAWRYYDIYMEFRDEFTN